MSSIFPGATLGIFGSGQLGRMLALEARRMGYRTHVFSPQRDTPAGQVADEEITAAYEDLAAVREFAQGVDVVTYEFENIPTLTIETAAEFAPARPNAQLLHVTQNRLREKTFLAANGFPVATFVAVNSFNDLMLGLQRAGTPAVLKTIGFGYDGKGQSLIETLDDAPEAYNRIAGRDALVEGFVDFACEISVVVARGADGASAHYGAFENDHRRHILDCTLSPARIESQHEREATEIALSLAEMLELTGVMCVEFFVGKNDQLYVNEIAPRPHNSGHLTLDAHVVSQFEQQLRAVCGLPLGSTARRAPTAAMVNLLGDVWANGEPAWQRALAMPAVKLHLYGKREARPARKMGHITVCADDLAEARRIAYDARDALIREP